jgi:hypothetical protein
VPLNVRLHPPGELRITVELGPVGLPPGCHVVLSPNVYWVERSRLLRDLADRHDIRVRLLPLPAEGQLELPSVWPGTTLVALFSPEGAVLAQTTVDVTSGRVQAVRLAPTASLAMVLLDNSSQRTERRFAVVSDAGGIILRTVAPAGGGKSVLLPAGTYRLFELGGSEARRSGASEVVELRAGEQRTWLR